MPSGARHHFTSWLPGTMITLLTFLASRMNDRRALEFPCPGALTDRSPEMATTSNFVGWMICSMASICSGTAGQPKCRSETWKTVVTVRPRLS